MSVLKSIAQGLLAGEGATPTVGLYNSHGRLVVQIVLAMKPANEVSTRSRVLVQKPMKLVQASKCTQYT